MLAKIFKDKILLFSAIIVLLVGADLLFNVSSNIFKEEETTKERTSFYPNPGPVPNVFGWRYNRSVCYFPETDETVLFFYAEDQNLYFGSYDDLPEYKSVKLNGTINPDYDVLCDGNHLYIAYSDPNQQTLSVTEADYVDGEIENYVHETAYVGNTAFTAVAPSVRVLNDSIFMSFMEYGRAGTETPNSKVYVVSNESGEWKEQNVLEHPADDTQVIGNSLENIGNSLLLMMAPYPGNFWFSTYDSATQTWTEPQLQDGLETRGQLEWQTLQDTSGQSHLVYRDETGGISYTSLSQRGTPQQIVSAIATHGFTIFEHDGQILILFNDGQLTSVGDLSNITTIEGFKTGFPYFLQMSEQTGSNAKYWWLEGVDGAHVIEKDTFDIEL